MVGIGDVLIGLNSNEETISVIQKLVSVDFGKSWLGKS
jgi:hypothetical protein